MAFEDFVKQWNKLISEKNELRFELIVRKDQRFETIIDDLIYRTNISEFPIGSLNFYPEVEPFEGSKFQIGFYEEGAAIVMDKQTGEILASHFAKEDPHTYVKVAKNADAYAESLLHYMEMNLEFVEGKRPTSALVNAVGGKPYMELYDYLLKQLQ